MKETTESTKKHHNKNRCVPKGYFKLFLKQLVASIIFLSLVHTASNSENLVAKSCTSALNRAITYETDVKTLYNSVIGLFNEN